MPLLGKRVYTNVKPVTDIKEGETIYTIPHTKEQFRSKEEYQKRVSLYKDRIWTCQCTGHINLSHEEAYNSEKAVLKSLKLNFAECYEKTCLELVHHSTVSLDSLVDQAWLKIQQCLCLNENVVLKVKNAGKVIGGKIIKIDNCGLSANPTSNCSSPSSDKENKDENGKKSPKKWVPPKLLPYKYTIKLEEDDKIINEVPASDLVRTDRPPPKDCLRLFIRAHAVRAGVTATDPWLVDETHVKKYSIPSKFNDFLISPSKMAEAARKAEEEIWRRKKKSAAKLSTNKLKAAEKNSKDNKKQLKLTGSSLKKKDIPSKPKSPKKANGVIELCSASDSDESDDCVLANLKGSKSCDSDDSDAPLSTIKGLSTPKKSKSNTSNKNIPLKKKQSMKQVTLYQLAHKPQKTPTKNSKTPEKKKKSDMPDFVAKMVKAFADKDKARMEFYLLHAVKNLTPTQRMKLPDSVRDKVKEKYDQMEEKKKLAKMTPEEREAYLRNKKNEEKRRKRLEISKRFEDQDLNAKPLPAPKLVPTPDGLPNEMFGDIAMVTEFISCFSGLLMPDDEYPIYSDALMKSLTSGESGFTYLSRVLTILLQTLLQDPIAEDYTEVKVKLTDIPVTTYTASELLRLCLRKQDVDDGASRDSRDNDDDENLEVSDDVVQLLETQELYELDPVQKLQLLKALCLRIMGSYSVQDYMEEKQRDSSRLWREKIAQFKERKDKKKQEKESAEKPMKENDSKKAVETENPEKASNFEITHFYGKVETEQSADEKTEDSTDKREGEDDEDNLASRIKNRRIMSAKAAKEKAEKEREKRIQLEKEMAIQRKQKEQDAFEKEFQEGIASAKLVLRHTHIGTDRNHSRYWIFNDTTPGLLIEKGWVTRHIDYCTRSADAADTTEDSMSDTDTESVADSEMSAAKKVSSTEHIEKTFPHLGQNLWFTYDSLKDVDKLLENLHPNGIRESALKTEIKKKYQDISKAITKAQRTNHELRDSNGEKEMLKGFREELLETELRLRNGGLGGVPDFPLWETKLTTSSEVPLLAECLLEAQKHVLDKFLCGTMKMPKLQVKEESKEEDDEEVEEAVPVGITRWRDAVENSQTLSRLSVMLGILDSCVKWEKSAENAKCKICRKKCNEESLLLCDECNQAFHCYCLRPAVTKIPDGEWFCPACIPESQKRTRHQPRYTFSDEDDSSEEKDIEHDEQCWQCEGAEGDLIPCGKCPSVYHIECHNPPLKYSPRGYWECCDCRAGRKRRKKPQKKKVKAKPVKQTVKEESSSEEEDSPQPRARRRNVKNRKRKRDYSSEDESDEEFPPSKSARRSRQQTSRTRLSNQNGDVDYEVGYKSSRRAPSELSVCEEMISRLMKHKASWPFIDRVDKKQVPDYYEIIKRPMTFQTIKQKLARLSYSAPRDVIADIALTLNNAEQYNKVDSEIYDCISIVEKYFSDLLKKMLPQYTYSREQIMNEFFSTPQSTSRRTKKV